MNTRSYPRNSTLAFPRTVDYASALERPAPMPRADTWPASPCC
jgi:hypothetical protein